LGTLLAMGPGNVESRSTIPLRRVKVVSRKRRNPVGNMEN